MLEQALAQAARLLERSPSPALAQVQGIVLTMGPHPPALLLQAQALEACGERGQALHSLEVLAQQHPGWGALQLEFGLMLGRAGRGNAALHRLASSPAQAPTHAKAWRVFGDHFSAIGDGAGADRAYSMHTRHAAGDPRLMAAGDASSTTGSRKPSACSASSCANAPPM